MKAQREALRGIGGHLLPLPMVVVASGNAHKLQELAAMFRGVCQPVSMKAVGFEGDIDENGSTFEENARIKAECVMKETGLPVLADDSGLSVDALGGAPGIYSARYAGEHGNDRANNELLLQNMDGVSDRTCRFVCAMALALPGAGDPHRPGRVRGPAADRAGGRGRLRLRSPVPLRERQNLRPDVPRGKKPGQPPLPRRRKNAGSPPGAVLIFSVFPISSRKEALLFSYEACHCGF